MRLTATGSANNGHSHNRTLAASLGFADPDKQNPTHELACHYLMQKDVALKLADALLTEHAKRKPLMVEVLTTLDCHEVFLCRDFKEWKLGRGRFLHWETSELSAEHVVAKGEGKYRTTVGFVDVAIRFAAVWEASVEVDAWECQSDDLAAERSDRREQRLKSLDYWAQYAGPGQRASEEISRYGNPPENLVHAAFCEDRSTPCHVCNTHKCCDLAKPVRLTRTGQARAVHALGIEVKAGQVPVSDVIRQINLYRDYCDIKVWALATPYALSEREIAALNNESIKHIHLGSGFREYAQKADERPGQSSISL